MKKCNACQETKAFENFYYDRGKKTYRYICRSCDSERVKNRFKDRKGILVEYKGGKCEECGYDKCNAALDFHHRDPFQKDFTISTSRKRTLDELKKEVDKCSLLCANCHREVEAGLHSDKYTNKTVFVELIANTEASVSISSR